MKKRKKNYNSIRMYRDVDSHNKSRFLLYLHFKMIYYITSRPSLNSSHRFVRAKKDDKVLSRKVISKIYREFGITPDLVGYQAISGIVITYIIELMDESIGTSYYIDIKIKDNKIYFVKGEDRDHSPKTREINLENLLDIVYADLS